MAVSLTTITGPVYLPNGATPIGGRVSFELSSWDQEDGEALIISGPVYSTIDENGQFSVELYTTAAGNNSVNYRMFVIWEDSELSESYVNNIYVGTPTPHYTKKYIGSFALSGPGPFQVSDLNIVSEANNSSFDAYLEMKAFADRIDLGVLDDAVAVTSANADDTAADRVQTGLDRAATTSDRTQTGLDRTATASDRVQTGIDRTAVVLAADRVEAVSNDVKRLEGAGNGVTIDESEWQAALADGRPIHVGYGKRHLVSNSRNTLGRELIGPGAVVSYQDGAPDQRNSYVPVGNTILNRHHLFVVKEKIRTGAYVNVGIIGDSTATNNYGIDIDTLVLNELRALGVNVGTVTSFAVSGTSWTTGATNVRDILNAHSTQLDLVIIKYGINEAAVDGAGNPNLAPLRNAMDSQLTALRASTRGALANLSILLLMPNTLSDTVKNTLWLEAIPGVYEDAARHHRCAIYNPYPEAHSAPGAKGTSLDSAGVHPTIPHNLDIWGRMLGEMLAPHGSVRRNNFENIGNSGGRADPTSSGIGAYPFGISMRRGWAADGYPFDGQTVTLRGADNTGGQFILNYNGSTARLQYRSYLTGSNTWTPWAILAGT